MSLYIVYSRLIIRESAGKILKGGKIMRGWDCEEKVTKPKPVEVECKDAKVVSETLSCCPSNPVAPEWVCVPLVKAPVVLTEQNIQIDVEAEVRFEEPVLEIKRIRKNVYIDQCKAIIISPCAQPPRGKLFIGGYVRKNIEYATVGCRSKGIKSGDIKHLTVKVPFKCITEIEFNIAPPVIPSNYKQKEFEVLGESCDCKCHDMLTGKKECEDIFITQEDFMEPIFCELEGAKIFEIDLHDDMDKKDKIFTNMIEKMVVYVKVKLLQKQQVKLGHQHVIMDKE